MLVSNKDVAGYMISLPSTFIALGALVKLRPMRFLILEGMRRYPVLQSISCATYVPKGGQQIYRKIEQKETIRKQRKEIEIKYIFK